MKNDRRLLSSAELCVRTERVIQIGCSNIRERPRQSNDGRPPPTPAMLVVDATSRIAAEVPPLCGDRVIIEWDDRGYKVRDVLEGMVCCMRRRLKNGKVRLFFRKSDAP